MCGTHIPVQLDVGEGSTLAFETIVEVSRGLGAGGRERGGRRFWREGGRERGTERR